MTNGLRCSTSFAKADLVYGLAEVLKECSAITAFSGLNRMATLLPRLHHSMSFEEWITQLPTEQIPNCFGNVLASFDEAVCLITSFRHSGPLLQSSTMKLMTRMELRARLQGRSF